LRVFLKLNHLHDQMENKLREKDLMMCRSCGNEERASEGYPCADCGTFVCIICNFRGVTLCKSCRAKRPEPPMTPGPAKIDWPEH